MRSNKKDEYQEPETEQKNMNSIDARLEQAAYVSVLRAGLRTKTQSIRGALPFSGLREHLASHEHIVHREGPVLCRACASTRLNGNCRMEPWPPAKRKIGEHTVEKRDSGVLSLH